jgi:hypothetical protein
VRDWQWDEILQHPERPLTRGQLDLLTAVNVASLESGRRAALIVRLLIELQRRIPLVSRDP